MVRSLERPETRRFARYLVRDLARYLVWRPRSIKGDTRNRARLAAEWLARAQDATGDGGLSYGYFPLKGNARGWGRSYPETSGYTIPTLLAYAAAFDTPEFRTRGLKMAAFVAESQMDCGALYGGTVKPQAERVAVAFNTGMGLLGLLAACAASGEPVYLEAARRAARFLCDDIGPDGHFRSHGPLVSSHPTKVKAYTALCAWPLYEAGCLLGERRYCDAALRVGDAVLRLQRPNGWIAENCLGPQLHAPLLHTIAYALQGLAELGIRSGEARFVEGARRGIDALLPRCGGGFLHGRWFEDWQPAAFSSCLTGSAQAAVVCYRLWEFTGGAQYRNGGDALLNYLKGLQQARYAGIDPQIVGAIGGSFPLVGAYMFNGFPGWATKFYLDALLMQHRLEAAPSGVHAHASQLSAVL
jgi:uncharacterized protein YyaL (SSP411 family)